MRSKLAWLSYLRLRSDALKWAIYDAAVSERYRCSDWSTSLSTPRLSKLAMPPEHLRGNVESKFRLKRRICIIPQLSRADDIYQLLFSGLQVAFSSFLANRGQYGH